MSKKERKTKKRGEKKLRDAVHGVYLAGLGAIATVGEEGAKLAHETIERGRKLAKLSKKKGKKGVQDAEAGIEANVEAFAGWVDGRVQGVLDGMGIPTRDEVQALNQRIETLIEKVSALETPDASTPADDRVTTFHVSRSSDGWQVMREGHDAPEATEGTKKAAMTRARGIAKSATPSRIVAYRTDGSVQSETAYGVD